MTNVKLEPTTNMPKTSGKTAKVVDAMSYDEYMTIPQIDAITGFRSAESVRGLLRQNLVRKRSIPGRSGAEYRKVRA